MKTIALRISDKSIKEYLDHFVNTQEVSYNQACNLLLQHAIQDLNGRDLLVTTRISPMPRGMQVGYDSSIELVQGRDGGVPNMGESKGAGA